MIDWLANAVRMMLARGKVSGAAVSGRTLLQVTRLANETFNSVELLLPPGYVARPLPGADVLVAQVSGLGDHKVALGGDNLADAVANLQPGEFGLSMGGARTLLFRQDGIYIIDTAKIVLQAPNLFWSPDGTAMHTLARDDHTHKYNPGGGALTDTQAPDSGLT